MSKPALGAYNGLIPPNSDKLDPMTGELACDKSNDYSVMERLLRLADNPQPKLSFPYFAYRIHCQLACSFFLAVAFIVIGAVLTNQARQVQEVILPYSSGDSQKLFLLDKDLQTDVFLYYELSNAYLNHKKFIEGKDPSVVKTLLTGVSCGIASGVDWVSTQRSVDLNFTRRVVATNIGAAVPCGVGALSMFSDRFMLFNSSDRILLDESNIALPADGKMYSKFFSEGNATLRVQDAVSWIEPGATFEHWKVWYRTPASPSLRNLWAVVPGGLRAGAYRMTFPENSPIWENWGSVDKRVVLSSKHALGSKGAIQLIGALALAVGSFEMLLFLVFAIGPFVKSTRIHSEDQIHWATPRNKDATEVDKQTATQCLDSTHEAPIPSLIGGQTQVVTVRASPRSK
jgi:hypothetical protein